MSQPCLENVLAYLRDNRSRYLEELCAYVRFPSVSAQPHHRADLRACAEWLLENCRRAGLTARLCPTRGNPILVARTPRAKAGRKPHFLVYGHYDVQPAEPFDLWKSPPFEPRLEGRSLFARGASDNKGQHLAHLKAIEAYLKTGTPLPCDVTFVIEGEEEVGSSNLATFLGANRAALACDGVVVSDNGMAAAGLPALTYALRGIAALEVKLTGPDRDLHSGLFGGSVDNPAMALCQMLGSLRDRRGRITVPGFYDDVRPLTAYERKELARLPFSARSYAKFVGAPRLFGERGHTVWEQRTARPTLEINGLTSGYQGVGSKTIVPSWASAKLTARLVPDQEPARIDRLLRRHLRRICPRSVRLEIESGHGALPYHFSPSGVHARAGLRALKAAFDRDPVLLREGGSIPIVSDFKRILKADTLLLGLALPDDNAHSPNEKFDLDCFSSGMRLGAFLWPELAAVAKG